MRRLTCRPLPLPVMNDLTTHGCRACGSIPADMYLGDCQCPSSSARIPVLLCTHPALSWRRTASMRWDLVKQGVVPGRRRGQTSPSCTGVRNKSSVVHTGKGHSNVRTPLHTPEDLQVNRCMAVQRSTKTDTSARVSFSGVASREEFVLSVSGSVAAGGAGCWYVTGWPGVLAPTPPATNG